MQRRYSRLATVEARRNIKTAVWFVALTITAIFLLFIFGIPILGKFAGFVSDIGGGKNPIIRNDKTPPAPPQVNSLPEFTNQSQVKLTGKSEEGATVNLNFNGSEKETVTDAQGEFYFDLTLSDGENSFDLLAVDQSGNESQRTKMFAIFFDDEKPNLSIDSPQEATQFYGSSQKQIIIQGVTETDINLAINDRFVTVDIDGKFQFSEILVEGENKFNIKATDLAGNLTEKDLTVFFTP